MTTKIGHSDMCIVYAPGADSDCVAVLELMHANAC